MAESFLDWLMRMGPGGGVYNAVAPKVQAGLDAVTPFVPPELRGKVKGVGQVGQMLSPATSLAEFPGAVRQGHYGEALLAGLGSIPGDPFTPLAAAAVGAGKLASRAGRAELPVLHGEILPPPAKLPTNEELGWKNEFTYPSPTPIMDKKLGVLDDLEKELLEILGPAPAGFNKNAPKPWGPATKIDDTPFPQVPFVTGEPVEDTLLAMRNYTPGSPAWKTLYSDVLKQDPVAAHEAALAAKLKPEDLAPLHNIDKIASSYISKWKNVETPNLSMNEAARQQRAKDLGYTTDTVHGTRSLDEPYLYTSTGHPDSSPWPTHATSNFYSSNSPKLADMYAWSAWRHPDQFQAKGYGNPNPAQTLAGVHVDNSRHIPLKLKTDNYHSFDAAGQSWTAANHIAIAEAKALGKDGVIIKNVWDEPQGSKVLESPNDVYITFNPSTARSPFAKFDPAKKDMNNLLAGLAGGGLILPWMAQGGLSEK